jgi:hypothetical protein
VGQTFSTLVFFLSIFFVSFLAANDFSPEIVAAPVVTNMNTKAKNVGAKKAEIAFLLILNH